LAAIDSLLRELDGTVAVETQPQKVRRRSRDFYWYSPVLKRRLDAVTADAVVTPRGETEVVRVLKAAYAHGVPVTPRGGGTGNYGQAMPLKGGIVLDLSEMTAVKAVGPGRVRVEAGRKLADVDAATVEHSRQELRLHPSTHKTGTIGGYVAGGSSGVGSITWGLLRDRGNILGLRVVTMEAEPRVLELRGAAIQQVNHAYGTNGIITELEMPLAPAYRWAEVLVAFPDLMEAARFADALAREDAILKKLVTVVAAPAAHDYLFADRGVAREEHVVLVMVAEFAREALAEMLERSGARVAWEGFADEGLPAGRQPLFEYAWNHTTLHALKYDRTITYLQTLFPPPSHLERVEHMARRFGDEVPMHLEFVRFGGQVACFGLQLVRYTTDERLYGIIRYHEENGCPIFDPHAYTLEEGGMKRVDHAQLAFKREADPRGLLNPGKMIGWDDPAYDGSEVGRSFLYEGS
jgi:FAD/FMN-containing dehydrogenase